MLHALQLPHHTHSINQARDSMREAWCSACKCGCVCPYRRCVRARRRTDVVRRAAGQGGPYVLDSSVIPPVIPYATIYRTEISAGVYNASCAITLVSNTDTATSAAFYAGFLPPPSNAPGQLNMPPPSVSPPLPITVRGPAAATAATHLVCVEGHACMVHARTHNYWTAHARTKAYALFCACVPSTHKTAR